MFDAVPNDSTGYVFAAYMVFLVLLLVYIGILGAKFQRISRDISQLTDEVESGRDPEKAAAPASEAPAEKEPSGV
jgi:hypothetical protein